MKNQIKPTYYNKKLILILAGISILRLLYIAYTPFDLSPDEAHYWEWSRHLSLSYYSKGPGVAYIIAFFTTLLGSTEFGVRAGAVAFAAGGSYFIYLIGCELTGEEKTGFYAALLSAITPLLSVGSALMTTDVPFVFFWAGTVFFIMRAIKTKKMTNWYIAGLLAGLGFLSKYTMVLIYPTLLLFILSGKEQRGLLLSPGPYVAGIITTVVSLPVFIWNFANKGVTFRHTLGQAHVGSGGFSIKEPLDFIASQAGLFTPLIFAGFVYGIYRCGRKGFGEHSTPHLFCFLASAFVFFFFLFAGFHGKVQANWAIAAYVTALPAAVWVFQEAYARSRPRGSRVKKTLAIIAGLAVLMGTAGTVIAYCPWLLEPMGAKSILWGPPFNRVTSWQELGDKVSLVKKEMEAKKHADQSAGNKKIFIMSNTYQITSELAFYTEGQPATYNINTGSRRMNQYDLWPGFSTLKGQSAIYVKGGNAGLVPYTREAFKGCKKERFPIYYKGRLLKEFSIFRCYGFKGFSTEAGQETLEQKY
ncbi:MAG: ArnT family glycosyltransferase [Thermodesulfobacteriota bacterium]